VREIWEKAEATGRNSTTNAHELTPMLSREEAQKAQNKKPPEPQHNVKCRERAGDWEQFF
jgi:hypothetical protein